MPRLLSYLLLWSVLTSCERSSAESASPDAAVPEGEVETLADVRGHNAADPAEDTDAADTGDELPIFKEGPHDVAMVTVEIKQENGTAIREAPQALEWDQTQKVVIESEDSKHELELLPARLDARGDRVSIKVWYDLNGVQVVAGHQLEMKASKRELMLIEDNIAFAFTVTPKTIHPPRNTREKIDAPKSEDPLAGAERNKNKNKKKK